MAFRKTQKQLTTHALLFIQLWAEFQTLCCQNATVSGFQDPERQAAPITRLQFCLPPCKTLYCEELISRAKLLSWDLPAQLYSLPCYPRWSLLATHLASLPLLHSSWLRVPKTKQKKYQMDQQYFSSPSRRDYAAPSTLKSSHLQRLTKKSLKAIVERSTPSALHSPQLTSADERTESGCAGAL